MAFDIFYFFRSAIIKTEDWGVRTALVYMYIYIYIYVPSHQFTGPDRGRLEDRFPFVRLRVNGQAGTLIGGLDC